MSVSRFDCCLSTSFLDLLICLQCSDADFGGGDQWMFSMYQGIKLTWYV